MDTHGYPSLRINTHFTLTKVIVYNPKINVLDIGYTSHGEPTNLFGASYMPLSFFPGCCPLAFGSQYRTKIPGGSEPWVPIVGRRRLQVPEDSEVLPFALQFFQTERKKVSTQFFPTSRNLGLSP